MNELAIPSIGQMIEFLGDDWLERVLQAELRKDHNQRICEGKEKYLKGDNLCNNLWEAVKEKLK